MALDFIPTIWAAEILDHIESNLVMAQPGIVNRDYEGEIRDVGDRVTIRDLDNVTIATYTKNSTVIDPQTLTDNERTLIIDQSKYFAFELDKIDEVQQPGDTIGKARANAGYQLAKTADTFLWSLYTGADAGNQLGTVAVTSAALAYTQLRLLALALDEADCPEDGRWAAVPPWFHSLLLESNLFLDASAYGNDMPIKKGVVGEAAGFTILKTNQSPLVTGDDYAVMAGVAQAISFAEQIVDVVEYQPENAFSKAVKGLHVYGGKVVRPTFLATVVASQT